MNAATPTWSLVDSYNFRQPERVFFNPFNTNEVWVASFGNSLKKGIMDPGMVNTTPHPEKTAAVALIPNPAKDQFTLRLNKEETITAINVTTATGQVIYQKNTPLSPVIFCSDWKPGVYFVEVVTEEAVSCIKLVKE